MKYKDKLKFSIIVVSLNTKKLFLKTINSILIPHRKRQRDLSCNEQRINFEQRRMDNFYEFW